MYKAQLVQAVPPTRSGIDLEKGKKNEVGSSARAGWEKQKLDEQSEVGRKYSVQIEYPSFLPNTGEIEQINTLFKADALRSLIAQRSELAREEVPTDAWWAETGDAYASSFEVMVQTTEFISVHQSIYSYFAGAAHPNHGSSGINYALNPLIYLHLEDLFQDSQIALSAISDYCIKFIELENHDTEPNQWVREGAAPDWKNYRNFYLQEGGLSIIFNPYEVGCYAEGQRTVFLAAHFLGSMVHADTKLRKLWWWPDV